MKKLVSFIFFLLSFAAMGQPFEFFYTTIGLGSNQWSAPELVIKISDTMLTYQLMKDNKPVRYEVPFRTSSRDSILTLLKGKEGQYIFASNYHVMSGAIQSFYFEYKDWCTEYSLKNTFDSTALHIVRIINPYLPVGHTIYIPYERWAKEECAPLIKKCLGDAKRTYGEILGEEYEYIRNKK